MADELGYHRSRAEKEIDMALSADNIEVARAHFALARLHADRLRQLSPAEARRPFIRM